MYAYIPMHYQLNELSHEKTYLPYFPVHQQTVLTQIDLLLKVQFDQGLH